MKNEETYLHKKFLIVNELSGAAVQYELNVLYLAGKRQINISKAISQVHASVINLNDSLIFFINHCQQTQSYIGQFPFSQDIYLNYELFLEQTIQIKYRKISPQAMQEETTIPNNKKRKVKERMISEAVQAVKNWRQLYEIVDEKGKRVHTLQSAAQKVGYAKKTLDDYFNQLRLAQSFGFNFEKNQFQKIGVLRKFVKNCQKKQIQMENMTNDKSTHALGVQHEIDMYIGQNPNAFDGEELY